MPYATESGGTSQRRKGCTGNGYFADSFEASTWRAQWVERLATC